MEGVNATMIVDDFLAYLRGRFTSASTRTFMRFGLGMARPCGRRGFASSHSLLRSFAGVEGWCGGRHFSRMLGAKRTAQRELVTRGSYTTLADSTREDHPGGRRHSARRLTCERRIRGVR